MDAFARPRVEPEAAVDRKPPVRPTREQAMEAVRTLIAWTGDDPAREGLIDTPKRVVDAYEEWFQGYTAHPSVELSRVFEEAQGYDDMVLLRDIEVESHCEHHLAPFLGKAYVAYVPTGKVVGISKIARVVEIFSKRLQNQENLTVQIANAIEQSLDAQGVAVMIEAEHQCMTTRGVHHRHVSTLTSRFTGVFRTDEALQQRFLRLARGA
jgi:GTP cyclohydrolase I